MEKVRVCHMADIHLGSEISGDLYTKDELNNNLLKTLFEIVRVLNQAKVDILLIAGDFYETSEINYRVLNQTKEILSKFLGKIFISPGNHDYVSLESVYHGDWPENVHIFLKEEIEYFEIDELNTRIYGFGFNHSHIYERKLKDIEVDDKYINIGVFHGQLDEKIVSYHPIFKEDIEKSGMDYIALGHVHKRSEIAKIGQTYYSYSGNPLGRGFDEIGEKGIYMGDISKNFNSMNFYKVSENQFQIENIQIEKFDTQTDIADAIRDFLESKFGKTYRKNYYRINLVGYRRENQIVNVEMINIFLEDIKYIEINDLTKIKMDLLSLSKEKSIKGAFSKNLIKANLSKEDMEAIFNYALEVFEE